MTFIIDDVEHEVGNKKCTHCWMRYPKPCKCGGLVHADFGGEFEDQDGFEDYWLYYACDRCGDKYELKDNVIKIPTNIFEETPQIRIVLSVNGKELT